MRAVERDRSFDVDAGEVACSIVGERLRQSVTMRGDPQLINRPPVRLGQPSIPASGGRGRRQRDRSTSASCRTRGRGDARHLRRSTTVDSAGADRSFSRCTRSATRSSRRPCGRPFGWRGRRRQLTARGARHHGRAVPRRRHLDARPSDEWRPARQLSGKPQTAMIAIHSPASRAC